MPIDTSPPPWLQRNWQPGQSFDPSPWLNAAFQQNIERQKLPLQLQQYALQNKASELAIEHQGMVNDEMNSELDAARQDQEVYKSALEEASKLPGGTLNMPPPPLKSKEYSKQWLQRQSMDAQTAFGKTLIQDQIELTKTANNLLAEGYDVTPAMTKGPNGQTMWDRSKISEIGNLAAEDKSIRAIELRKAGTAWHYDAQGNPIARAGNPPAAVATLEYRQKLKQQIADAEDAGQFDTADSLRDDLASMDRSHPDIREKARYQAITSSIRNIEHQLGDLTLKSKWPDLEKKKEQLLKELQSSPMPDGVIPVPAASPAAAGSTNKSFIWTPQGIKPK